MHPPSSVCLGAALVWLTLRCRCTPSATAQTTAAAAADQRTSATAPHGGGGGGTPVARATVAVHVDAARTAVGPETEAGRRIATVARVDVAFANRSYTLLLDRPTVFAAQSFAVLHSKARRGEAAAAVEAEADDGVVSCHYEGRVDGHAASSASVTLCGGVSGAFRIGADAYALEAVLAGDRLEHYVYSDDPVPARVGCGIQTGSERREGSYVLSPSLLRDAAPSAHRLRRRGGSRGSGRPAAAARLRRAVANSARRPAGSSAATRFVELYLVLDNTFHGKHGEQSRARAYNIINYANSLLRKVDIYLVLVGLEIWDDGDKIAVTGNSTETLANFLRYRKTTISPSTANDNAQLITGRADFGLDRQKGVVGKAYIGGMCSAASSGGISLDNKDSFVAAATTMVHELGHNLGLYHDGERDSPLGPVARDGRPPAIGEEVCKCDRERSHQCIMASAATDVQPTEWSECSKNEIRRWLTLAGRGLCLADVPKLKTAWGTSYCGNYLVEGDEQCDCGPPEQCDSRCCDAATCRLQPDAVCATGECCDLTACSFKVAATPCRSASSTSGQPGDDGLCDVAEYCTGAAEYCPADLHVLDGTPCRNAGGPSYCHDGKCQTRAGHCKLLWGREALDGDPYCYARHNTQGDYYGHCGRDPLTGAYSACDAEQVTCGQLQCFAPGTLASASGGSGGLARSLPSYARSVEYQHTVYDSGGAPKVCRTAVLEIVGPLDHRPLDLGMVPNGTYCGEGRVCMGQRCVPIEWSAATACESGCSGRGRCNSLGHCHCDYLRAPPTCAESGAGGSLDSGPASVYRSDQALVVGLLVTFVGVLPLLGLAALLAWRCTAPRSAAAAGLRWRIMDAARKAIGSKEGGSSAESHGSAARPTAAGKLLLNGGGSGGGSSSASGQAAQPERPLAVGGSRCQPAPALVPAGAAASRGGPVASRAYVADAVVLGAKAGAAHQGPAARHPTSGGGVSGDRAACPTEAAAGWANGRDRRGGGGADATASAAAAAGRRQQRPPAPRPTEAPPPQPHRLPPPVPPPKPGSGGGGGGGGRVTVAGAVAPPCGARPAGGVSPKGQAQAADASSAQHAMQATSVKPKLPAWPPAQKPASQ